jgi:hypothetical protein
MTDTTEYEVPPKMPPDWRDWINEFPSVKSVAFFSVIAWITTALVIGAAGLWGYYTGHEPAPGIIRVLEIWLDALNWLTAAAVFGVVGKRLSEKPEVIRAEGEVKAAQVAAATAPGAPARPVPVAVAPVTDLPDVPGEGD